MVAAFPVFKLGFLLMKQISKPLANFAKRKATSSPFFRRYICMPPAQLYHFWDVRVKMYMSNIIRTQDSGPIPKLNEQAAIELGANLLGELIIISIASGILIWEYNRQKEKELLKEEKEATFFNNLEQRITDLAFQNEELDTKLRELTRLVYATPAVMEATAKFQTDNQVKPVSFSPRAASNAPGTLLRAVDNVKIKLHSG